MTDATPHRRDLLALTLLAATGVLPATAGAAAVAADHFAPPGGDAEARRIWARLNADLSGRTVFFHTHGAVWGFKPQADDLPLADFARRHYGYTSLIARKALKGADGAIVIRQKSWVFYRDPETDEITDQVPNPYTGAIDHAAPMSGPVGERSLAPGAPSPGTPAYPVETSAPKVAYDMRIRRIGGRAWVTTSSFTRLKPGGIGWWKLEGELGSFACRAADLDNPKLTHLPSTWSQNLVAEWQTWTGMHGQPGHILFKGDGAALAGPEEIPTDLMAAIARFFPGTFAPVVAWDR
ncbi:hypothetical protein [Phenylobacterium aquaticum]|uniref:hypothetical protein n=1 Tax=Phenylobacterium aquaticum TaxID=1763816 RepID=UPI0026EAC8F4|nr:hypothetical protein [Phenylobacterium aquaticum]